MANWSDILSQINSTIKSHQRAAATVLDTIRRENSALLSEYTKRNVIAYYSSYLTKPRLEGIDIGDGDKNALMNCVHGLDRSKGLDLILHTPGGDIAATESIVQYLRSMFANNVRAVVPQIAMSAGTMIACSCKSIIMGKQSSLGPIDPHINGISADVVKLEIERAYNEIKSDPVRANIWAPILNRYPPSFVMQCELAIEWSKQFVAEALRENMFAGEPDSQSRADSVVAQLSSSQLNKAHSKHLHAGQCKNLGLRVELMEDDQQLQEKILTVHHCYIHTTTNTPCVKIMENHEGRALVRNAQQSPNVGHAISIGFGPQQ